VKLVSGSKDLPNPGKSIEIESNSLAIKLKSLESLPHP